MSFVLVSSCLLGNNVRYDGGNKFCEHPILLRWIVEKRVISICPEIAGGLPVPRPPAEIKEGSGEDVLSNDAKVFEIDGNNVSKQFVCGATESMLLARKHGIRVAVLKDGSPSCGSRYIYDGSFNGATVVGSGVTTALLRKVGVKVFSENELQQADQMLRELDMIIRRKNGVR